MGGADSDILLGRAGPDTLTGVDPNGSDVGMGTIDRLTGGKGFDTFVLGNEIAHFYDDDRVNRRGLKDFAVITDLKRNDIIQLNGTTDDYVLRRSPSTHYPGTGIFHLDGDKKELIGIITGDMNLSLDSSNFSFIG